MKVFWSLFLFVLPITAAELDFTLGQVRTLEYHIEKLRRPKTTNLLKISNDFLAPFPQDPSDIAPKEPSIYSQARDLFLEGNLQEAKALLHQSSNGSAIVSTHWIPGQSSDDMFLGVAYLRGAIETLEGRLNEAAQNFESIIKAEPRSSQDKLIQQQTQITITWVYEQLGRYLEAQQTLTALLAELEKDPTEWIQMQPAMQALQNNLKLLEEAQTTVRVQKSHYQGLRDILVKSLEKLESKMSEIQHPKVEIPLDPKRVSQVKIVLDGQEIYGNQEILTGSVVSFPVDFGLHRLGVFDKEYWLSVSLDPQFEVHFGFAPGSQAEPKAPDLSEVTKLNQFVEKIGQSKAELQTHVDPIFEQLHQELSALQTQTTAQLEPTSQQLSVELGARVQEVQDDLVLVSGYAERENASQLSKRIQELEHEKNLALAR